MGSNNEALSSFKDGSRELMSALGDRALHLIGDRVSSLTDRLEDIGDGGPLRKAVEGGGKEAAEGGSPLMGGLKGAMSGVKDAVTGGGSGSGGSPKATKATNIVEQIDVGVPVRVAYNQWTEFGSFPSFMKKVESVEAAEDNKLEFKAQIFLSHRRWQATILEQAPDERIVWRSKGEKGHVDGAVTFHELGPNLTRILLVLEYYPQGLFERTGNLWRAQGRRTRVELKHFRRHVMTRTILDPDSVQGWRGVIEDGEVVQSHEDTVEEEQEQEQQTDDEQDGPEADDQADDQAEDEEYDEPADEEYDDEPVDEDEPEEADEEADEDEPLDEEYEDEPSTPDEDEPEDDDEELPEDEYEDEPVDEDEPDEDAEEPEEEPEERPTRRRRAS